MQVQKFNISVGENYTDKQGVEKTMWHNVGTLTIFNKDDGSVSRLVEIPAIGLKANAFPITPRDSRPAQGSAPAPQSYPEAGAGYQDYPDAGIDPSQLAW